MTIDVTAIPTVSTFEDTVSHRPDIDADLGGAILENEADSLPERDGTGPCAEIFNQDVQQVAAFGGVVPTAIVVVDFTGAAPFIDALLCANKTLSHGDFTLVDTADGDTSIRWTTADLPILTTATCTLNADDSSYTASVVEETGLAVGTSGVRLRTRSGGTLTNIRSTVVLY